MLGNPSKEHLILAALDHSMVHARQGKCPGVTAEEVKHLSRVKIAQRKGIDLSVVEACVHQMRERIKISPSITIGTQAVADLQSVVMGVGYSLEYLCTLEALADLEVAAVLASRNTTDAPEKIILCGAVANQTVESFLRLEGPAMGLVNIYGGYRA